MLGRNHKRHPVRVVVCFVEPFRVIKVILVDVFEGFLGLTP